MHIFTMLDRLEYTTSCSESIIFNFDYHFNICTVMCMAIGAILYTLNCKAHISVPYSIMYYTLWHVMLIKVSFVLH